MKRKQYNIREKELFVPKQKKPINFTFTDEGKVIFKKKLNVENFPEQIHKGIDYINIQNRS